MLTRAATRWRPAIWSPPRAGGAGRIPAAVLIPTGTAGPRRFRSRILLGAPIRAGTGVEALACYLAQAEVADAYAAAVEALLFAAAVEPAEGPLAVVEVC